MNLIFRREVEAGEKALGTTILGVGKVREQTRPDQTTHGGRWAKEKTLSKGLMNK